MFNHSLNRFALGFDFGEMAEKVDALARGLRMIMVNWLTMPYPYSAMPKIFMQGDYKGDIGAPKFKPFKSLLSLNLTPALRLMTSSAKGIAMRGGEYLNQVCLN